ncbi:MAG TPA: cytochrome c biogenesis protein CcdA [Candidatus Baltobacteraceae bacterium]|nr:cytochrome c biogenesis protein CcdA [Candidatus Baltobacteraceae bacterium]
MIDAVAEGLRAVATRSPLAVPLVFAAGVATSAGPCVAPRYVAVAALANGSRRPMLPTALFVGGLVAAYAALALAAGAAGALRLQSAWTYGALSAVLVVAGAVTLLRGERSCPEHPCRHAAPERRARAPLGGAFLLGASSALVVSPCCTPMIAAIAGVTVAGTRPLDGVLLVTAYGCGHALPLFAVGSSGRCVGALFARARARLPAPVSRAIGVLPSDARSTISGTLMLALGAYYGAVA